MVKLEIPCQNAGASPNYLHTVTHANGVCAGLTGQSQHTHLCDQVLIFRIDDAVKQDDRSDDYYTVPVRVIDIHAVCVSVALTQDASHLLVNTRPWVEDDRLDLVRRAPAEGQQVPDIQTVVEAVLCPVADGAMEPRTFLRGPHAFTMKDAPFQLGAIAEPGPRKPDYVASGGEDGHIYIWHMRHERLLRALPAHKEPVNSVAWHPTRPCVAACSDDFSLTVWSA